MVTVTVPAQSWYEALCKRDPAFEGRFFYAVTTTGVYCRPTCRSRRPLEHNVRFYQDAGAAREAGFRPCKRCKPDEAAHDAQQAKILAACAVLDAAEEPPGLAELGRRVGMSPAHLQRTFKRIVGISPRAYGAEVRAKRLRSGLAGAATVTDAIYEAGHGSSATAYADAAARFGTSPGRFKRGGAGLHVTYGIYRSALGHVLVAMTERGICSVRLGDDEAALEAELATEFAAAERERADDAVASAASQIVAYVAGEAAWPELPLDVRATAFQARVWDALRKIAPGTTTSYGELARVLGDERATRAVARACASNPVALLIPCHRVVAKNGELTGYRWGLERKRALLETESGTDAA